MCLAWHPLWNVIARQAGARRQTVLFVVLYLDAAPDEPMSRDARTVAAATGGRVDCIDRILDVLDELGVIDADNRLAEAWVSRYSVTGEDGNVTDADVTPQLGAADREIERIRALNRERQRRKRARDRAAPSRDIGPPPKPRSLSLVSPALPSNEGEVKDERLRAREPQLPHLGSVTEVPTPTRDDSPVVTSQPKEAASARRRREPGEQSGTRLPTNWCPDAGSADFARSLGLNPDAVADEFRDYWSDIPGAKGRKISWRGTWKNWCRRKAEDARRMPPRQRAVANGQSGSATLRALARIRLPGDP